MPISPVHDPTYQPMKAHDLGVQFLLGKPDGSALVAPTTSVIPMIPV